MRWKSAKLSLLALSVFLLIFGAVYLISNLNDPQSKGVSVTSVPKTPSPTFSATNSTSPTPTAEPTRSESQTPIRSKEPKLEKTKKPKFTMTPTPTKSSTKQLVPVKFGNSIPINEIYPFPIVGKQIDPGYYHNSQGACDLLVYDKKGNEIFSEQSGIGQQVIIYLQAEDQVQNYCILKKGLPPIYQGENIPTGMHIINGDLKPGNYTTSNNCFYWITKGNSALDYTRGVTNDNDQRFASTASVVFSIGNINEAVFFHSGCGVITKVS